ncbi:MAG: redoxin domain-containing protein [Planctomycetes bacterium]|nr:redoxin domain-containing protein [Planctomycetota bacterium]
MRAVPLILAVLGTASFAQPPVPTFGQRDGAFHEGPHQRATLLAGTGDVDFDVTTKNRQARLLFNQGIGLVHGSWYYEAERSFHQVLATDPKCAMAYWGLTLANTPNPSPQIWFAWEAYQRRAQVSPRERLYIEAWARFLSAETEPKTVLVDAESGRRRAIPVLITAARRQQLHQDLGAIAEAFPDDVEARALLVRARLLDPNRSQPSADDDERRLLEEIFTAMPLHPANRYASQLGVDPVTTGTKAALSAPGIARMWHVAGNAYTRAGRHGDAAVWLDIAARVDHAHMNRTGALTFEVPNYARTAESLCDALTDTGRFDEAIALAKRMVRMPRHPRMKDGIVARGQRALITALASSGRWKTFTDLADGPYLAGSEEAASLVALLAAGQIDNARQAFGRPLRAVSVNPRRPTPSSDVHGPASWSTLPAPPFDLARGKGGKLALTDYAGRNVLVVFYLGAACLHCVEQIHEIKPKTRAFKQAGIEIVTIGTDTVPDVKAFIQQLEETGDSPMPFPLLSDPKGDTFKDWRCWDDFEDEALHGTFLIDAEGRILWRDISVEPFMETEFLLQECKRLLGFASRAKDG